MGHASATVIKQMKINKLLIPKQPTICPGCTQGKMHNKPHLVSEKQAKHALDLLHCQDIEPEQQAVAEARAVNDEQA